MNCIYIFLSGAFFGAGTLILTSYLINRKLIGKAGEIDED